MNLTDKESKAVLWLIDWTDTWVKETLWWSEDATKSGECDEGYYNRVKDIVDTIKTVKRKLDNELPR